MELLACHRGITVTGALSHCCLLKLAWLLGIPSPGTLPIITLSHTNTAESWCTALITYSSVRQHRTQLYQITRASDPQRRLSKTSTLLFHKAGARGGAGREGWDTRRTNEARSEPEFSHATRSLSAHPPCTKTASVPQRIPAGGSR